MSTRERWVIYPLLFLTLGIVVRDKLAFQADEATIKRLRCSELRVDNAIAREFGAVQIQCGQLQTKKAIAAELAARGIRCGELLVDGPDGRPTVVVGTDPKTKGGSIFALSAAGVPLIRLQPTDSGGVVFASGFKLLPDVVQQKPKTPAPKDRLKQPEKTPVKAKQ
jgi:hypothetical protein